MGERTHIQWTNHTFSPWFGCTRVSGGCDNCYSEDDNARYKRNGSGRFGHGEPRVLSKGWDKPMTWNARIEKARVYATYHGLRERVFPSLCDPFDEEVPDAWRDALMVLIHATPFLDWLLLTKRPHEALRYLKKDRERYIIQHRDMALYGVGESPLPKRAARASLDRGISHFPQWQNLHIGATVENQPTANHRREAFRSIPVPSKFVSYEPALGPVDWTGWEFVQQIIYGGESGGNARASHVQWTRDMIAWCRAHGVAPFVKQLGAKPIAPVGTFDVDFARGGRNWPDDTEWTEPGDGYVHLLLDDRKGGEWSEWPRDLRIREFPRKVTA